MVLDTAGFRGSKDVIKHLLSPALSSAFFYDVIFLGLYSATPVFQAHIIHVANTPREGSFFTLVSTPSYLDSHWPELVYVHLSEPIIMARGMDYAD